MFVRMITLIAGLLFQYHGLYAAEYTECRGLANPYGPFDYTNPVHFRDKLPIVEGAHFTKNVEQLISGARNGGNLLVDLNYTLKAFPNHHRALNAVAKYRVKHKHSPGSKLYSAECYFDRALDFKPDDGVVYMLYGIYLHRVKEYENALKKYRRALDFISDSAEANYNIGLLLYDMKRFKESVKYAKKAYNLGYPLPALKTKLQKKGIWKRPEK